MIVWWAALQALTSRIERASATVRSVTIKNDFPTWVFQVYSSLRTQSIFTISVLFFLLWPSSQSGRSHSKFDMRDEGITTGTKLCFGQLSSSERRWITLSLSFTILLITPRLYDIWNGALLWGTDPVNYQVSHVFDWSRLANTQPGTTPDYRCNPVLLFESLHCLSNNACRLLMYPFDLDLAQGEEMELRESHLLKLHETSTGYWLRQLRSSK